MATRNRLTWAPDARGYYTRQIGWEHSKSGKLQQHKFLLGTDRKQAEIRDRKLRELWDQFEKSCTEPRPLWPAALMEIALRIAKGIPDMAIPRAPREMQHQYAARLQRMQAKYPVICFVPEDQHAYEVGLAALALFESIPTPALDFKTNSVTIEQLEASQEIRRIAQTAGIPLDPTLDFGFQLPSATAPRSPLEELGILKPGDPAAVLPRTAPPPSKSPSRLGAPVAARSSASRIRTSIGGRVLERISRGSSAKLGWLVE